MEQCISTPRHSNPNCESAVFIMDPRGTQSGGASMSGHRPSSAIPIVNPQVLKKVTSVLHRVSDYCCMRVSLKLQICTAKIFCIKHFLLSVPPLTYDLIGMCSA